MSLRSKLAGMQITWIFMMSHWLITFKYFSKPHLHGKKKLFSSSSWSRLVMIGSTDFFPYFQVLCPNSMLQARLQMGQMHLGQKPTEAQPMNVMMGHKVWASVSEWGPFCAMPENWEKAGQVVERQTTSLKAQPLSRWTCSLTFPSAATMWRRYGEKCTEAKRRDTGTMFYVRNTK